MKPPTDRPVSENAPGGRVPPSDETTGLPGLRTWRSVYFFVLGVFVLWVGLLTVLTRLYS
jgi:hypothetical protein